MGAREQGGGVMTDPVLPITVSESCGPDGIIEAAAGT